MKNSAIKGMFYSGNGYIDNIKPPKACDDDKKIILSTLQELQSSLSPDVFKIFEKHIKALENIFGEETGHYFTEGFKLGLKIGLECMTE